MTADNTLNFPKKQVNEDPVMSSTQSERDQLIAHRMKIVQSKQQFMLQFGYLVEDEILMDEPVLGAPSSTLSNADGSPIVDMMSPLDILKKIDEDLKENAEKLRVLDDSGLII